VAADDPRHEGEGRDGNGSMARQESTEALAVVQRSWPAASPARGLPGLSNGMLRSDQAAASRPGQDGRLAVLNPG
jgi:hypothetical protein